ncbi:MAG: beta-N-acetylhexosaminidase [Ruminococcaceae bacterium]|nr:beta-N-acetylhexosaminidase [Oscillospiraceae bacterium]
MKITFVNLPTALKQPLEDILPLLSFSVGEDGIPVTVRQNENGPELVVNGDDITLSYHKIPEFFRLLTMLPSHVGKDGTYAERPAHEDLCLMSDCSRNAVLHMDAAKRMIRYLALMGFTAFMLYTEDTYEIPEYPAFGHMRGRYSHAELKEIDDYAASYGIEVIPCIQVLGHLTAALKWPDFNGIKEDEHILLVGADGTYQLIDAMLRTCRECFRSKRIHIGMDEAHGIGRGAYLTQHGYRPSAEIFLEHLNKVVGMCQEYDFAPMIWSDMFFRTSGFPWYYTDEGEIPQHVVEMVPEGVTTVYWDYYNYDKKMVRHMLDCHHKLGRPVAFAGGAWKWASLAPRNYYSLGANDVQLPLCREDRLPLVIATAWGDHGALCSHFSVMTTLQQYAEYCYAKGEDRDWVKERFEETFHLPFDTFLLLDEPNRISGVNLQYEAHLESFHLFYNDPLHGIMDPHILPEYTEEYAEKARRLEQADGGQFEYIFRTSRALCRLLSLKATLSKDIRQAYDTGDRDTLRTIAEERIPATLEALEAYHEAHRAEWHHDNKPFGFDVVDLRNGGIKERLRSAQRTIEAYLEGHIDRIAQLEEPIYTRTPSFIGYQNLVSFSVLSR